MSAVHDPPEWAKPQVEHPEWTVDVDAESGNVGFSHDLGLPATMQQLSIIVSANAAGWRLVDHSRTGDQLTFAPGGDS